MFSRSIMQVGADAGLTGGFQSGTLETRCSIANAPTSMTIRVTHIYRRIDGDLHLSIVTPISPSDQRTLDQGTARA